MIETNAIDIEGFRDFYRELNCSKMKLIEGAQKFNVDYHFNYYFIIVNDLMNKNLFYRLLHISIKYYSFSLQHTILQF